MVICLSLEDAMNLKITIYRKILSYNRNMQCAPQIIGLVLKMVHSVLGILVKITLLVFEFY